MRDALWLFGYNIFRQETPHQRGYFFALGLEIKVPCVEQVIFDCLEISLVGVSVLDDNVSGDAERHRHNGQNEGTDGQRIVKEHYSETRDQSVIGHFRRRRRRHVRNFEGDGAFIGSFAAASQLDQSRREIKALNDASRRCSALDLQRRSAAATTDIGNPTRRSEI